VKFTGLIVNLNRVEVLYETAIIYSELSYFAKFLIASHFQISYNDETTDAQVFKQVVEKGIYDDFKNLTIAYRSGVIYGENTP
jgi:hypothetical protein